jgi:hypothetical protein
LRTGFTADVCFVRVIEGMTDALERQTCELSLMDCLSKSGIVPDEVEINEAGCFVIVPGADVGRLKKAFFELKAAVAPFNAAIRLHEHCGRILLERTRLRDILPPLADIIAALHRAGICVVHATSAPAAIALIVDGIHLERAQAVIAAC